MNASPTRPRLVDGLLLAPLDRGLAIDGGAQRQVLRGPAATTLLPRLLPLLDGTRRLPGLVAALADVAAGTVEQAVALLWERGLVEEGTGRSQDDPHQASAAGAFVARMAASTSHNRSGHEAVARLADARVTVVADGPAGSQLASELTGAGIGRVEVQPDGPLTASGAWPATASLVVGLEPWGTRAGLQRLADRCADGAVPWLRTAVGADGIEIGPHFAGPADACYCCFAANRPGTADGRSPTPHQLTAWASLTAIEVCYLIARVGRTVSTGGVTSLDLGAWTSKREPVLRRPGCHRCGPPHAGPGGRAPGGSRLTPAYRREQAGALPSPEMLELADPRPRPTRSLPRLTLAVRPRPPHPSPSWAGPPAPALGPRPPRPLVVARGPRPPGAPAGPRSAARLSPAMLADVLGGPLAVTDPGRDRSPGAPAIPLATISPVQAYVFVHRVADLGDGWHWWHSRDGVFVPLGTGTAEAGGRAPGAVIALTASLAQLEESHGPVGHRLAHLATGRVAYQLLEGLARAGMPARLRPDQDPAALARELGLDPDLEPVTAVIDLPARTVRR